MELQTDTVVMINADQYDDIINSLHTLNVNTVGLYDVMRLLLALAIAVAVIALFWVIVDKITRYM